MIKNNIVHKINDCIHKSDIKTKQTFALNCEIKLNHRYMLFIKKINNMFHFRTTWAIQQVEFLKDIILHCLFKI